MNREVLIKFITYIFFSCLGAEIVKHFFPNLTQINVGYLLACGALAEVLKLRSELTETDEEDES